ncbi:MAG: RimK/LysX family protein [bacterium]|nr:RimK/LysX family protein [bacterium]
MGWREWVSLPDLGIKNIKAKIDTGAKTSSIHAFDIKEFTLENLTYVSFSIQPIQRNKSTVVSCKALLVDKRKVKDSGGKTTLRPVIATPLQVGGLVWLIELTLINRNNMGFRMLLGRAAFRNKFLIHPGKSFMQTKQGI